jgi:glucose-1-phosphate thymidylyltransferase
MQEICAVIAAGGLGTRLKDYKDNKSTKVLIQIENMSMISSQIEQIFQWGVKKFIVITNPEFDELIRKDIHNNHSSKDINFAIQHTPSGIAHALLQVEKLIKKDLKILFVLGDNFFGENPLKEIDFNKKINSKIFVKNVENPKDFGVLEIQNKELINIIEKPKNPKSNMAVVGIYLYDPDCFKYIKQLKPSNRGELEITDLNNLLISKKLLDYKELNSWWIDAGTEERIEELKKLLNNFHT